MRTYAFLLAAAVFVLPLPAQAHKVVADVYADGAVLHGEIGYSSGDMAANALVEVFDAIGTRLAEVHTDAQGQFTYRPQAAQALRFHADLGGGHVADVAVAVEDLPLGLAAAVPQPEAATPATTLVAPAAVPLSPAQTQAVAEAVRHEIRPLVKELAAYKEKNDLQAILGGIGYIAGLCGLGFYLVARERLKRGG